MPATSTRTFGTSVRRYAVVLRVRSLKKRFWEKVRKTSTCWNWIASKGPDGLGRISAGRRGRAPLVASRVSWELANGRIPDNHCVIQTCRNTSCVRPEHLRLVARGGSIEDRFWRHVSKTDSCWVWTGGLSSGYGSMNTGGGYAGAHRVSWELHFGPVADGLFVLHKCDNRGCVRPDHLFLGTHEDNMSDMRSKGRSRSGESHGNSRLSEENVRSIRRLHKNGTKRSTIAKRFSINPGHVTKIVSRKAWACIR